MKCVPRELRALAILVFILLQSACGNDPVRRPDQPGEVPAPSPTAAPTGPTEGLRVGFDVAGQTFHVLVTNPPAVTHVLNFAAGTAGKKIPNAPLLRGQEFNSPWSWHMDGSKLEFADLTIEVCDGTPAHVENELDHWVNDVGRYCPWGARIIEVDDCRSGSCVGVPIRR